MPVRTTHCKKLCARTHTGTDAEQHKKAVARIRRTPLWILLYKRQKEKEEENGFARIVRLSLLLSSLFFCPNGAALSVTPSLLLPLSPSVSLLTCECVCKEGEEEKGRRERRSEGTDGQTVQTAPQTAEEEEGRGGGRKGKESADATLPSSFSLSPHMHDMWVKGKGREKRGRRNEWENTPSLRSNSQYDFLLLRALTSSWILVGTKSVGVRTKGEEEV